MEKELEILEKRELRDSVVGRIEVLDKVGELLLLPNTECASTEQVARFYGVKKDLIRQIVVRNREELDLDGLTNKSYKEINNECFNSDKKSRLDFCLKTGCSVPSKGSNLFTKRAILRVGMLLRDSEVAKEIRTRLLDIVQDTENENPNIIQNVVGEINEEKQLMLDRIEAEMNGDFERVCVINAKLFALKNKRIAELEIENKTITTNALTIIESRKIINRLVRMIATKEFGGLFGATYGELYTMINYKLGINIKARKKKAKESYINTLDENETFEVEKIVRVWANDIGINVEKAIALNK